MRQTLFYIPHELFGLPMFGFGWALILWALASALMLGWLVRRQGFDADVRGSIPVILVIAAVIAFVMPHMEVRGWDGALLGLPIRGYGVMLLLGVVCGVGIAVHLAWREGFDSEIIYALSFWMFAAGIVGARLFFVRQYWKEDFRRDTWAETLVEIVRFTEGGLVVFGAVIGSLIGFVAFAWRRRLPVLVLADIIAPAMILGLAVGRIGCLFNGCCYGAMDTSSPFAIAFPRYNAREQGMLSPPYLHQLASGRLHGVRVGPSDSEAAPVILEVVPGSPAEKSGLPPGTVVRSINGGLVPSVADARMRLVRSGAEITMEATTGVTYRWSIDTLPSHSLPVHPTQLYSSLNAALLFLLLWAYFPFRVRDGQVFALLMTLYAITRFCLERIRVDEPGQWGTTLTVSQLISVLTLVVMAAFWTYLAKQPRRRAAENV